MEGEALHIPAPASRRRSRRDAEKRRFGGACAPPNLPESAYLRSIDPISKDQSSILTGYGKIKDVAEDSDGSLYFITNNRDFFDNGGGAIDKLLKIVKNN